MARVGVRVRARVTVELRQPPLRVGLVLACGTDLLPLGGREAVATQLLLVQRLQRRAQRLPRMIGRCKGGPGEGGGGGSVAEAGEEEALSVLRWVRGRVRLRG